MDQDSIPKTREVAWAEATSESEPRTTVHVSNTSVSLPPPRPPAQSPSAPKKLPLEHHRPRHDRIHDARRQCTLDADLRPVPTPPSTLTHVLRVFLLPVLCMRVRVGVRVGRVWGNGDDVGGDPELDGTAAARRGANRGPADQGAGLVREDREGEVCCGPANGYVCSGGITIRQGG